MGRHRYPQIEDGEWFRPGHDGYKFMCCDCHLVHALKFRVRGGQVEVQFVRDGRATAAARRAFGFQRDDDAD